jgi:hypothetical protein
MRMVEMEVPAGAELITMLRPCREYRETASLTKGMTGVSQMAAVLINTAAVVVLGRQAIHLQPVLAVTVLITLGCLITLLVLMTDTLLAEAVVRVEMMTMAVLVEEAEVCNMAQGVTGKKTPAAAVVVVTAEVTPMPRTAAQEVRAR